MRVRTLSWSIEVSSRGRNVIRKIDLLAWYVRAQTDRQRTCSDGRSSPRPLVQQPGQVEVIGMLRSQEQKNSFTPENKPEKGEWVFSNIEEMAKYTGAEPVLVDEILGGSRNRIHL